MAQVDSFICLIYLLNPIDPIEARDYPEQNARLYELLFSGSRYHRLPRKARTQFFLNHPVWEASDASRAPVGVKANDAARHPSGVARRETKRVRNRADGRQGLLSIVFGVPRAEQRRRMQIHKFMSSSNSQ